MDCSMPGCSVLHCLPEFVKFMSIELVMLSNYVNFHCLLLLLSSIFPSIRVFFPMNGLFTSGGQSIGASDSAPVLPMTIQGWFPIGLTGLISVQFGSYVFFFAFFLFFFVFWGNSILFSIVATLIYISTNSVLGFPFLHILGNICYFALFMPFWQAWGDITLRFWFAFLWWLVMLSIFLYASWLSVCFLWEKSLFIFPSQFCNQVCFFLFCY